MTKASVSVAISFVALASFAAFGVGAQAPAPPPPPPPPPPVLSTPFSRGQSALASDRPIPLGTGDIRGVVVEAQGGQPVVGAIVTLSRVDQDAPPREQGLRITRRAVGPGMQEMSIDTAGTPSAFSRPAVSDSAGRFAFNALPAGTYQLNAARAALLTVNYGQTRSGGVGRPIQLDAGQQLSLTLQMQRPAAIEGTVVDEFGAPLVSAQVQATRYGYVQGVPRATTMAAVGTDDRGRYRIFGLVPGEYVVSAVPNAVQMLLLERAANSQAAFTRAIDAALARRPASGASGLAIMAPKVDDTARNFAPTYFPSSPSAASAGRVAVEAGAERSGVDITYRPARMVRVRGLVAGAPGPHVGIQVTVTAHDPSSIFTGTFVNRAQPDGSFSLASVVPGQYVVAAATVPGASPAGEGAPPPLTDAERLWARAVITIDGDQEPFVVLSLQPGRSLSGIVVAAGRGQATAAGVHLALLPAVSTSTTVGGPLPQATSDADGRFELRAIPAGQFTLRAGALVKSVLVDGQDVLDLPLDVDGSRDFSGAVVMLADRLGQLSGTVTGADGTAVDLTAVLVAADRRYWTPGSRRLLNSRADTSGRFTFSNLPAGEYLLAALTDLDPEQMANPDFLAALTQGAVRVTIADGGTHVQNIRVAR